MSYSTDNIAAVREWAAAVVQVANISHRKACDETSFTSGGTAQNHAPNSGHHVPVDCLSSIHRVVMA